MSRAEVWIAGARPRTLGASITPVLVGTAAAGTAIAWRFVAALLVGLGLQIGVNFANDFNDGIRGVDTAERLGPPRLTSSGVVAPRAVLAAALGCVLVAGHDEYGHNRMRGENAWGVPFRPLARLAG